MLDDIETHKKKSRTTLSPSVRIKFDFAFSFLFFTYMCKIVSWISNHEDSIFHIFFIVEFVFNKVDGWFLIVLFNMLIFKACEWKFQRWIYSFRMTCGLMSVDIFYWKSIFCQSPIFCVHCIQVWIRYFFIMNKPFFWMVTRGPSLHGSDISWNFFFFWKSLFSFLIRHLNI